MGKNIFGKGLNKNIWHYNYCNKKVIHIYNYFNKEDFEILKNLGIIIENKLYSHREFDIFYDILFKYYETNEVDELLQCSELKKLNISKEKYQKILDIFDKIEKDNDL